jgi:hypothetical protein
LDKANLELLHEFKFAGVHHARVRNGQTVHEALRVLRADAAVESASLNYINAPTQNYNMGPSSNPNLPIPNDPMYPKQWHLSNNGRVPDQRVPNSLLHDQSVAPAGQYNPGEGIYLDDDNSGTVTAGDIRVLPAAGSGLGIGVVQAGDADITTPLVPFNYNEGFTDANDTAGTSGATYYSGGVLGTPPNQTTLFADGIYRDLDNNGVVSVGDIRLAGTAGFNGGGGGNVGVAVAAGDPDVGLKLERMGGAIIDADIDAPQGWAFGTDCSSNVAAIIDTGIDVMHEDIMANLWNGAAAPNPPLNGQSFSGVERHTQTGSSPYFMAGQSIYQDDDNSMNVSAGDTLEFGPGAANGTQLINFVMNMFNGREMHRENVAYNGRFDAGEFVYLNLANNSVVSIGDQRLTAVTDGPGYAAGTFVRAGDADYRPARTVFPFINNVAGGINELHDQTIAPVNQYNDGEGIYNNLAGNNIVTAGDIRIVAPAGSGLPAGVAVSAGNPAAVPPVPPDADIGNALIRFNANERHDQQAGAAAPGAATRFVGGDGIYRDLDNSWTVTPDDFRITAPAGSGLPSSSIVRPRDNDVTALPLVPFFPGFLERHAGAGAYAAGQAMYQDRDANGVVSAGDFRLTPIPANPAAGFPLALPIGIVRAVDADARMAVPIFDFAITPAMEAHDNTAGLNVAFFFSGDGIYLNNANNGMVTAGDMRIVPPAGSGLPAGAVSAGNPAAVPPVPPDADIGTRIYAFTLHEVHNDVNSDYRYNVPDCVINNRAANDVLSTGDQRMQAASFGGAAAGSVVAAGDADRGLPLIFFQTARNELHDIRGGAGPLYAGGDGIYNNFANNGRVTAGDFRIVPAAGSGLTAGIVSAGNAAAVPPVPADPDIGNALIPFAWDVQGNNISDPNGHGTGVAGVIGAEGNNGKGIAGVCWKAQIMGLRTDYTQNSLVACINWIMGQQAAGVPVIIVNESLGGTGSQPQLQTAMMNAMNAGMLFTVSAGNDSNDNNPNGEPQECIYRNLAGNGRLTVGDLRITGYGPPHLGLGAGTTVKVGDEDFIAAANNPNFIQNFLAFEKYVDANNNGQYDAGEMVYRVLDGGNAVSVNCIRLAMFTAGGTFYTVGKVNAGDPDLGRPLRNFAANEMYHDLSQTIGQSHIHLKNLFDGAVPLFPASYNLPRQVTVAATDNSDNMAGFSSWGTQNVHIAAPGHEIYTLKPGNAYQYISGTSFSAPLVAGILYHTWTRPGFQDGPDLLKQYLLSDYNGAVFGSLLTSPHGYDHRYGVRGTVMTGTNGDARARIDTGDDFGDAPDSYRSVLPNWGARAEDLGDEWLGRDPALPFNWAYDLINWVLPPNPTGSTPEYDAVDNFALWPPDPDGIQNLVNTDKADDGVVFVGPFNFSQPGAAPNLGTLRLFIDTANNDVMDGAGGRYAQFGANPPLGWSYDTLGDGVHGPIDNRNLWVNAWFDWNQNGSFDDPGEHVFMLACNPTAWAQANPPTHGAVYYVTFNMPVAPPGAPTNGQVWARFRLDYGEDSGQRFTIQNPTLPHNVGPSPGGQIKFWDDPGGLGLPGNPLAERYESVPVVPYQNPVLDQSRGLARYGEVEDYVINLGNNLSSNQAPFPVPDQIHLYGPASNNFPVYVAQTLTAMVENNFIGLPGQTVVFSDVLGALQFLSGSLSANGAETSVATDSTGAAPVQFLATTPGPALIQAYLPSTGQSAYLFMQVQAAIPGLTLSAAPLPARAITLQLTGTPGQNYSILRSTDLQTWTPIATVTALPSGAVSFTDASAPPDRAFYSAVASP